MKRWVLLPKRIFLAIFFLISLSFVSNGQADTIAYKTGEKVAVRVDSVGPDEIFYKAPTGTELFAISKSQILYIKYEKSGISMVTTPIEVKKKDSINKSFISVYTGIDVPLRNPSSSNNINFSSCKNYGALAEYGTPHSHFGFTAEFNYNYNSFDFNNFFIPDFLLSSFALQSENAPYFKVYTLLGGGFWEITSGGISVTTRALAGYANFQSPTIEYSGYSYQEGALYYNSTQQSFMVMQKNSSMLSLDLGVSVNLRISEDYTVLLVSIIFLQTVG